MRYHVKRWNGISVIFHTTVRQQCDVIQSNFAFRVGVDLHLYGVHIPVHIVFVVESRNTKWLGLLILTSQITNQTEEERRRGYRQPNLNL